MNRRHSGAQAVEAVRMAQGVGFDNITIDLIFGVAGFDADVLQHSIDVALGLGVQHISAYHLTIEGNTPFARRVSRGEFCAVDDQVSQAEYRLMEEALTGAGYDHYEVSNYAREGYRSRHNSSYWRGVQYLGVGAAAHSFNGVQRRYAVESIEGYLAGGESRYECEELGEEDRYNELVMTSLRCREGVDLVALREMFPSKYLDFALASAAPWLSSGQLVREGERMMIPTKHFLVSDSIIESLFWVSLK